MTDEDYLLLMGGIAFLLFGSPFVINSYVREIPLKVDIYALAWGSFALGCFLLLAFAILQISKRIIDQTMNS